MYLKKINLPIYRILHIYCTSNIYIFYTMKVLKYYLTCLSLSTIVAMKNICGELNFFKYF